MLQAVVVVVGRWEVWVEGYIRVGVKVIGKTFAPATYSVKTVVGGGILPAFLLTILQVVASAPL